MHYKENYGNIIYVLLLSIMYTFSTLGVKLHFSEKTQKNTQFWVFKMVKLIQFSWTKKYTILTTILRVNLKFVIYFLVLGYLKGNESVSDIRKKEHSRHEFKYLSTQNQLELLNARLDPIMNIDHNTNNSNTYRIRSIYFDDLNNSSFKENEYGITPREKWRIRAYNEDSETISLECKRKEYDKVIKTSCKLSYEQYQKIISGQYFEFHSDNKLLNRFLLLQRNNHLKPKVIVGYERKPFIYRNGNVRITFDTKLYSSPDISDFFSSTIRKRLILPTSTHMIEVKYDEYLPDFINRTVQMSNMERITFSKYYYCRKYSITC